MSNERKTGIYHHTWGFYLVDERAPAFDNVADFIGYVERVDIPMALENGIAVKVLEYPATLDDAMVIQFDDCVWKYGIWHND